MSDEDPVEVGAGTFQRPSGGPEPHSRGIGWPVSNHRQESVRGSRPSAPSLRVLEASGGNLSPNQSRLDGGPVGYIKLWAADSVDSARDVSVPWFGQIPIKHRKNVACMSKTEVGLWRQRSSRFSFGFHRALHGFRRY